MKSYVASVVLKRGPVLQGLKLLSDRNICMNVELKNKRRDPIPKFRNSTRILS